MRFLKIILMLCGISVVSLNCASESGSAAVPENQVVAVQRGDLVIDITASGNLELSRKEDLAFDIFYLEATVEEVLVEEGDTVEEGQLVARLDASEWDDQLSILEDGVTTAERQLTAAQRSLTAAERNLVTKQRAVLQAEINVENAEIALYQARLFEWPDIEDAQADLDKAEFYVEYASKRLEEASDEYAEVHWARLLDRAGRDLSKAQENLDLMLSKTTSDEVVIKRWELEVAEGGLEDAQLDIEDAQLAIEDAQTAVEDAQKDLEDAREELAEAESKSPEVKASFDGFIINVNAEGGDEVKNGHVAAILADPGKFEANIMVSEMDILQVGVGGEAWVEVDAIQGMRFPAKVTHIAPTATIQSGVVNYEVRVEIESLEALEQEGEEATQPVRADIAAGELPPPLQQAIDEGRLTREQVEEMIKQGPPAGMEPPLGMEPPPGMEGVVGQGKAATSQEAAAVPEDFQLREGLTVTVSVIVEEKSDILLVPNAAITREEVQSYVQVVSPDGTIEKRTIQTGTSNYQFTEVTEGLSEGEQVLVPQGTTTTSTTTQPGPPRIGLFGPR